MRPRNIFIRSVVLTIFVTLALVARTLSPSSASFTTIAYMDLMAASEGYKPNCSCSSESNYCDRDQGGNQVPCSCGWTCNYTNGGCGTLWLYDCTGKCSSGPCVQ